MEKSNVGDEQALLELMSRTGYTMLQENGQRKYGGPPPDWDGPPPQKGCEVFVGKIPRDCFEDELVPAFEKVGKIYELRLMMDFSGSNRGYAFVMFTNKNDAQKAVREMNNYEIRKGRLLGVCPSVDNCRLFVGGIPKNKTKEEILSEMEQVTDGVVDVIVYPSAMDKTKNRGFAFVEYLSHRMAAMARRKLIPGRIQLWGHQIAVDWAEPEQDVDEDIMREVKILYVRNLMLGTTEDTIYKAFTKASGEEGVIERVKKLKDYAFVHFKDRDAAIKAMKAMDGTDLDCSRIEVVLAKPVDKAEYNRNARNKNALAQKDEETSSVSDITESLAYGLQLRDPAMTMYPPMFTPQQALMARGGMMLRGRGRGAAGMRGAGARHNLNMFRNPRYAPEGRLYDIVPGMELKPTNPDTLKPHTGKSYTEAFGQAGHDEQLILPPQILGEVCEKNGWGQPNFSLHSTMSTDGSGDVQLFLFKVTIAGLNAPPFQPNKLCRTVDEAKVYASEYVLQQLNVPLESSEMYMGAPLNMPMPMGLPSGMPGPQCPPMSEMSYMPSVMKMPPPVPPPHMVEQFYHQGGYPMGPPPVSSMQAQY